MRYRMIALGSIACVSATAADARTRHFAAALSAGAEVPALKAPGTGTVSADLDTATRTLSYRLDYVGLTGPAEGAHFHGPAGPRATAPHLLMLGGDEHHDASGMARAHARLASPIAGSVVLTPAQAADLMAGRWYVNVHTKANPAGEIRGQLAPAPRPRDTGRPHR